MGKTFKGGVGLSETSALPVVSGQDNIQMQFSLKVRGPGPGKLAQQLGTTAALPGDPGRIPSNHFTTHNHLTTVSGDPMAT